MSLKYIDKLARISTLLESCNEEMTTLILQNENESFFFKRNCLQFLEFNKKNQDIIVSILKNN